MKTFDLHRAAQRAVAANPTRPATAIVHDSPDARLVLFRLSPGQAVPLHRNDSTVTLAVVEGRGSVWGRDGERSVTAGDLVVYDPDEPHAMRASDVELVLLATITPRPG